MCDNPITNQFLQAAPLKNRYYLIDYENVHQFGLTGIEKLSERDTLAIFYSVNSNSIPLTLIELMRKSTIKLELHYIESGGKNALDFQLSSYLGYILGKEPDADCHIISGDKGYEYVRAFWKDRGIHIKISVNIAGEVVSTVPAKPSQLKIESKERQSQKVAVVKATDEFDCAVKPLNLSSVDKEKLRTILNKYASGKINKRKQNISNDITRQFGNTRVKVLYKAVKPLIK